MSEHFRESILEAYLVNRVARQGGEAEKFVSPEKKGVPDRQVLWHLGLMDYVEMKATGETADAHQKRDHKRRRERGFKVFVLDSHASVDWYINKGRFLSFAEYMRLVAEGHLWVQ